MRLGNIELLTYNYYPKIVREIDNESGHYLIARVYGCEGVFVKLKSNNEDIYDNLRIEFDKFANMRNKCSCPMPEPMTVVDIYAQIISKEEKYNDDNIDIIPIDEYGIHNITHIGFIFEEEPNRVIFMCCDEDNNTAIDLIVNDEDIEILKELYSLCIEGGNIGPSIEALISDSNKKILTMYRK